MENTARKLFIIIGILFFLIFAFLFFANDTAFADTEISYLEYNTSTKEFEIQTISSYTSIESTTDFSSGGTFVLDDDVELTSINCGTNNLTLILCDGKTLSIGSLICKDLTIYAQELGTGKIAAKSDDEINTLIKCSGTFNIHGGEITTGENYVNILIDCTRAMTVYNAKFNGKVNIGIHSLSTLSIENSIVDLDFETNAIYARQDLTINNGIYNIVADGCGTAIYSNYARVIINNGTYDFTDVEYGFVARQELIINHGKINIVSSYNAFKSEQKTIFIRGTVVAHSEDYPVAQAAKTITVSYANMLCTTNCPDYGVFHSDSISTGSENVDLYYKNNEGDEWYSGNGTGPNSSYVKFLKVVPIYNHITVWVEDISVEEGIDISSIDISFSFGYYDKRDEDIQDLYKDAFDLAATFVSVTVDCDGMTPGTYDYVLNFSPEYEGNIDDHYDIVFGDEVGHFIVAAAAPAIIPDPEPEQQEAQEQPNDTSAPSEEPKQDEPKEATICLGKVVIFVDIGVFVILALVVLYLLLNKKNSSDNNVRISKYSRIVGLLISICALVFAVVVIIMHQCAFSIGGIIWAAINVALFGVSCLYRNKQQTS